MVIQHTLRGIRNLPTLFNRDQKREPDLFDSSIPLSERAEMLSGDLNKLQAALIILGQVELYLYSIE